MKVNLHVFVRFDLMNEQDRLTRWVWPFAGRGILLIRPKDGWVEKNKVAKSKLSHLIRIECMLLFLGQSMFVSYHKLTNYISNALYVLRNMWYIEWIHIGPVSFMHPSWLKQPHCWSQKRQNESRCLGVIVEVWMYSCNLLLFPQHSANLHREPLS